MPRKKDAKVLGRCECPQSDCAETVSVLQNARGYLYSQCPSCGCDQRNGVKVQTYLWHNTKWNEGAPERPRNVSDKEPVQEPETKPDEPEKQPEKQQDKKRGGIGLVLVPLGILAAIVIGTN